MIIFFKSAKLLAYIPKLMEELSHQCHAIGIFAKRNLTCVHRGFPYVSLDLLALLSLFSFGGVDDTYLFFRMTFGAKYEAVP